MADPTVLAVNGVESLASLAIAASEVKYIEVKNVNGARPFVVLAKDQKLADVEGLLDAPLRPRGNTTFEDLDSFVRYVAGMASGEVYWSHVLDETHFVAVFNADTWRDHTAGYAPLHSVEWRRWFGKSGVKMSQADYAAFVEDNAPDIVMPPAGDMIEISRSLEAKTKVAFASGIRLANGQSELTYTEEIAGSAAKGRIMIPETFKIGIPVFVAGVVYAIDARLRYRINGGSLVMWHELIRPHVIVDDALQGMVAKVAEGTKRAVFRGTPSQVV